MQIHGINPEQVKNEPTFPIVWEKIKPYFENSIIVGHNVAASDINALVKTCSRYNLELPEIYYIDTVSVARDYVPYYDVQGFSLHSLCDYFDLCLENEHKSYDDLINKCELILELLEQASSLYYRLNKENKRIFLKTIYSNFLYDGETVTIKTKRAFELLYKCSLNVMVGPAGFEPATKGL